jgi:DNA-binding NarL/FixJ family response regulator
MKAGPMKALIVDDEPLARERLASLLREAGGEVVGEAADGRAAVEAAAKLTPDVILLDIRMPVMDGVEAARRLSDRYRVMMLTYSEDEPMVVGAIQAGAHGYLVHGRFDPDELARAVRDLAEGRQVLSPAVAPVVFDALRRGGGVPAAADRAEEGPDALTSREREIMGLIARGYANRVIAGQLFISEKTVKNHIRNIYEKLGVASRGEATARWLGIVRDEQGPPA